MDTGTARGGNLDGDGIAAELAELKREGCHLLVTGVVSDAVRARQTRNLFGSPRERRRRILALVSTDLAGAKTYLPGDIDVDDEDVALLDFSTTVRSTVGTETSGPSWTTGPASPAAPGDGLVALRGALERELVDAVSTTERTPGRIRVGVLTLGVLLDEYGLDRTRGFVTSLGRAVRTAGGMGHCHLPLAPDATETEALVSAFDARIDLRHRDGRPPEQRWHLTESDSTTDWMLL
ncbi:DUF7504 family protein [Halomarina ordinaria]|uniref:Uncharacterized protein n=1 Tax=Halomarina ordinaria TaxID=3033939 RepID=A0ABD5UB05_9EURY|nr:hypothetical protein [Halomarina sp. PSRA2]